MNPTPLVSVIMPAYNAGNTIVPAIRSLLVQTYPHWELIVVNDGSTDATRELVEGFTDPRIRAFNQENMGIGSARNVALAKVRGEFLCMLDSDDVLPPNSIKARLGLLQQRPEVDFCEGRVILMDQHLDQELRRYAPSFRGAPFHELVKLNASCFFGATWMVRLARHSDVRFHTPITHAEDLLFYMEMACQGGLYDYVDEVVLLYRRTPGSSMTKLDGLERSYHYLLDWLRAHPHLTSLRERLWFAWRIHRIMAATYWKAGQRGKALRAFFFRPPGVQPQSAPSTPL